jgi:hypothetical protein
LVFKLSIVKMPDRYFMENSAIIKLLGQVQST